MEARLVSAALLAATLMSMGAGYRTQHFIVTAPNQQLAMEIGQEAERFRRDLAIEWLGHELRPWRGPCPITAQAAPHLGAGGATSFMFEGGQPFGWTMTIQGSRERVLDSVLPHEITHTIFATHFGQPLPRWADEGACTTVEHESERRKQQQLLIRFLKSKPSRGIAFNRMFAMREYPPDVLPLYSQGYSLVRFLIAQGGKHKFIQYVGDGLKSGDWNGVTRKHYGFQDLSNLQLTWVDWVKRGSPPMAPSIASAPTELLAVPNGPSRSGQSGAEAARPATPVAHAAPIAMGLPAQTQPGKAAPSSNDAPENQIADAGGWYDRNRDRQRQSGQSSPLPQSRNGILAKPAGGYAPGSIKRTSSTGQMLTRPQPPGRVRQTVIEGSRGAGYPILASPPTDASPLMRR